MRAAITSLLLLSPPPPPTGVAASSSSSSGSAAASWKQNPVAACVNLCTPVSCFSQRSPVNASSSSLPQNLPLLSASTSAPLRAASAAASCSIRRILPWYASSVSLSSELSRSSSNTLSCIASAFAASSLYRSVSARKWLMSSSALVPCSAISLWYCSATPTMSASFVSLSFSYLVWSLTCAACRVRYAEDHAPSGLPAGRRSPRAPMTDFACSAAASAALAICANLEMGLPSAPLLAPFFDLPLGFSAKKSSLRGETSPESVRFAMDGHLVATTSVSSRTFGDLDDLGVFTAAKRSSSAALACLFAGLPPAGTFLDPRLEGSSSISNCFAGRLSPAAAMFAALPIAFAFRPGLPFSESFLSFTVFSRILPSLAGLGLGAGSVNARPMGTSSMSSSVSGAASSVATIISDFFTSFFRPGLDLPGLFSFPSLSAMFWSFFASLAASTGGSFGLRLRSGSGALTMVLVSHEGVLA
mmetsp:Transcript_12266/g.52801  ORF Transcript_12266/g.52801 Transcript_12266/m.52801 type:complete len:473 (+) Transcript_12266:731-2149(+)